MKARCGTGRLWLGRRGRIRSGLCGLSRRRLRGGRLWDGHWRRRCRRCRCGRGRIRMRPCRPTRRGGRRWRWLPTWRCEFGLRLRGRGGRGGRGRRTTSSRPRRFILVERGVFAVWRVERTDPRHLAFGRRPPRRRAIVECAFLWPRLLLPWRRRCPRRRHCGPLRIVRRGSFVWHPLSRCTIVIGRPVHALRARCGSLGRVDVAYNLLRSAGEDFALLRRKFGLCQDALLEELCQAVKMIDLGLEKRLVLPRFGVWRRHCAGLSPYYLVWMPKSSFWEVPTQSCKLQRSRRRH